jgi:hypothetical protein
MRAGSVERTIKGTVSGTGTITLGTDFTVVRNSAGFYTVRFLPAFSTPPIIIASATTNLTAAVNVFSNTATAFNVAAYMVTNGTLTDMPFSFIAIGRS